MQMQLSRNMCLRDEDASSRFVNVNRVLKETQRQI